MLVLDIARGGGEEEMGNATRVMRRAVVLPSDDSASPKRRGMCRMVVWPPKECSGRESD